MATQKQRKRRAKEKRHDYELMYVDEDGVERPVEKEEEPRKPVGRGSKGTASKAQKSTSSTKGGARRGRTAQPPSWNKVLKRGAIFAPIFFATVLLLGGGKITYVGAFVQSMLLLAVFIPFSYFMDRVVWRQQQKRLNKS
ncbi:MAG: hypothetical protein LH654_09810 [Thermoleophilia bacterium]|nr:hypothetical protein [Thermoleophilia bacterium]